MDFSAIARAALGFAKLAAPFIPGGQAGLEAGKALVSLIDGVRPHADPPTRAELDQLRADVNARVDATIDSLGDGPG